MVAFAPTGPAPGCPDRGRLVEFDRGLLAPVDLEAVAAHLSTCDGCARALDELQSRPSDDPVLDEIRRCMGRPAQPIDRACAEMADAARAMVVSDASVPAVGTDARAPGPGLPAGQRVGGYELRGEIGRGGMGVVYRAYQRGLGRLVALKMVLAGHHAGASAVARFVREGKAVARLVHPNVVQVHELGEHDGLPFLAMELVEGGTLQEKLDGRPLGPRGAAAMVRTLALAVEYAHGEGVIHRDLKPSNILLAGDGTPRISDFGLARLLDAEADGGASASARLTGSEAILGTASYMAPEQAEGRAADVGRPTDVYALGAILYAALTGQPPFVGATRAKTLDLVRKTAPAFPPGLRPRVPSGLGDICLTCLEKSPRRRYPTARALADDLDRWLRDERPHAAPRSLARLARGPAVLTVLLLLGLILALVSIGGPLSRAQHRELARFEGELLRGRPVSLIGRAGGPGWFRVRAGARSGVGVSRDGSFAVESWRLCLLELLPDPGSQSYRITAQVRHDRSATMGEVGLYFAHKAWRSRPAELQFFSQLTFNAVRTLRGDADVRERLGREATYPLSPGESVVHLSPHLYSDEAAPPYADMKFGGVPGPPVRAAGEDSGIWHDLEITVTAAKVTAHWDGKPFSMDTDDVRRNAETSLARYPPHPGVPQPPGFVPAFEARGGLGLYVWRGAASFRSVTVTPF